MQNTIRTTLGLTVLIALLLVAAAGTNAQQADTRYCKGGNLACLGTGRADYMIGSPKGDEIKGYGGNDTIKGRAGDDTIDGMWENDTLEGEGGNDKLAGFVGTDILRGGTGMDELDGGNAQDRLLGQSGVDRIESYGDSDKDYVSCGSATDTALVDSADVVSPDCERVKVMR